MACWGSARCGSARWPWPIQKWLHAGPSAYSDLAVLPNGNILCFYEQGIEQRFSDHGRSWAYRYLAVAKFDLEWLLKPEDQN